MAQRILTADQPLPFRLHPLYGSASCTCGKAAEVGVESDDARGKQTPWCLDCITKVALSCPAGDPAGQSSMPRTVRTGCVMRDAVGNRPARFWPKCTDAVAAVMIGQGENRHYRVRSQPLCARHADMLSEGTVEEGSILLGIFAITRSPR